MIRSRLAVAGVVVAVACAVAAPAAHAASHIQMMNCSGYAPLRVAPLDSDPLSLVFTPQCYLGQFSCPAYSYCKTLSVSVTASAVVGNAAGMVTFPSSGHPGTPLVQCGPTPAYCSATFPYVQEFHNESSPGPAFGIPLNCSWGPDASLSLVDTVSCALTAQVDDPVPPPAG